MTDPYQIKTFEDALNRLQDFTYTNKRAHTLYREYEAAVKIPASKDLLAYTKLKIITFVLNEKWVPGKNNDARYGIYITTPRTTIN